MRFSEHAHCKSYENCTQPFSLFACSSPSSTMITCRRVSRKVVIPVLVLLVFTAPVGVDGTGLYSALVFLLNSLASWPAHLAFRYTWSVMIAQVQVDLWGNCLDFLLAMTIFWKVLYSIVEIKLENNMKKRDYWFQKLPGIHQQSPENSNKQLTVTTIGDCAATWGHNDRCDNRKTGSSMHQWATLPCVPKGQLPLACTKV